MVKNMKLSMKIALGFVTILAITAILSITGIYNMNSSSKLAQILDKEYVPEVKIATNLRGAANRVMYAMRGYGYTAEEVYLEGAQKELVILNKYLIEGRELEKTALNLKKLTTELDHLETSKGEYEKLVTETIHTNEELAKERAHMDEAAGNFIKSTGDFLQSQDVKLAAAIKGRKTNEITERVLKLRLMNEIIDLGNDVRIKNFKSQAIRDSELMEGAFGNFDKIDAKLVELRKITVLQVDIDSLNDLEKNVHAYKSDMTDFLATWKRREELSNLRNDVGKEMISDAMEMADAGMINTERISEMTSSSLSFTSTLLAIGSLIVIILGMMISIIIVRSITKPIIRVVEELGNGADQVFNASEQLSMASQELAEGSSEQASSIEETSSTLDETSSMVAQNTENTKQAVLLSSNAKEAASSGNHEMNEMMEAMDEIKSSSDEISKIIKVIDDIAFQTNILALNAAVEAARAGDAGMGFAVVAEEVRNLAQRSAQAAKDTSSMIEKSIIRADRGVEIARKVSEALVEIRNQSDKVNEIMDEITTASQEQSQGVVQITKAVSQMEQVTQSIASNAEESAASSEELSAQAQNMKRIVDELTVMVYGNLIDDAQRVTKIASIPPRVQKIKKQSLKKAVIVNPAEVIPLEEDALDF